MNFEDLKKELEKYIDQIDWLETQEAINTTPTDIKGIINILRENFWNKYEKLFLKYFRAWGVRNIYKFPHDCYITWDEKFVVRKFNNYFHFLKVTDLNSAVLSSETPNDFWERYPDYYISGDFPEIVMMLYIIKKLEKEN